MNRSLDTGSIDSSSSLTQSGSMYLNGSCNNKKNFQTTVDKQVIFLLFFIKKKSSSKSNPIFYLVFVFNSEFHH